MTQALAKLSELSSNQDIVDAFPLIERFISLICKETTNT